MKDYRVKLVDSFTKHPLTGNPAGVVLRAKGLTDPEMQAIAREINAPETAFVLPPDIPGADICIRWFSIRKEVPLCGHATVAAFHALAEEGLEGMHTNGQHLFRIQTKSGLLRVRVEKNFYETAIEFELPVPSFKAKKSLPAALGHALGIHSKDIRTDMPIVADSYLYVPVKKLAALKKLTPNFAALARLLVKLRYGGVCLFSLETEEKLSSVHSRFFAPNYGIDEDPVTGSANGPLGRYLQKFVLPGGRAVAHTMLPDGRMQFVGEQGDVLGRPGRVRMRIGEGGASVSIVGEAVTVFDSQMKLS